MPSLRSSLADLRALIEAVNDEEVSKQLKNVERHLLSLARKLDFERNRRNVDLQVLRGELREELIAREANVARISEKQRAHFEHPDAAPGMLSIAERASVASSCVEAAIRSMDIHALKPVGETNELVSESVLRN